MGIAISGYTIEVPVADWKAVFVFLFGPNDSYVCIHWKISNKEKIRIQNFLMSFKTLSLDKNKAKRQIWNSGEEQAETYLNKLFYHFQIGNSSNFKFLIIFWLLKIPAVDRYCAKWTGILKSQRLGTLLSKNIFFSYKSLSIKLIT